jgi:hypothetical protein
VAARPPRPLAPAPGFDRFVVVFRNDLVKQAVDDASNALVLAEKYKIEGDTVSARRHVDLAYARLLRLDRGTFDAVDSHTLAGLLGPPPQLRIIARLCKLEGDLFEGEAKPVRARAKYRRALELLLEARQVDRSDEDAALVTDLRVKVPADTLMARYR